MPQGYVEGPYLSQNLNADLDETKSLIGSTLFPYRDDLLLCSPSQAFSQGDSIHLLIFFNLKGT